MVNKSCTLPKIEGVGIKGYFKAPSRILFDIVESLLNVIGSIPAKLKAECACQVRKFDKKDAGGLQCRGQVRYKVFDEGIIESVDEANKTYHIRFVNGIKPINP